MNVILAMAGGGLLEDDDCGRRLLGTATIENEDRKANPLPATRESKTARPARRVLSARTAQRQCVVGDMNAQHRTIAALEHDPEKWKPVFGKDHAPR
jgi:hypothetical protein